MNRRGFLHQILRVGTGAVGATLLAKAPQTGQWIEGKILEFQPVVEAAPKFIVDPADLSVWQRGLDGAYSIVNHAR